MLRDEPIKKGIMNDTPKIERHFEPEFDKAANEYEITLGPSYLNGLPDVEDWHILLNAIENPVTKEFAELWHEKAKAAKGVPLRQDFDFRTLVKFGRYLALYKRTEEGHWLTTFCGDGIVEEIKLELSNKYIHEYADKETLKFWMDNIQQITEQCRPVMEYYTLEYTKEHHKTSIVLNLPLKSGDSDLVDMFICHESFLYL